MDKKLNIENNLKQIGIILVQVKRKGKIVKKEILQNTITNNALDEIIKPLYGQVPDMEIKYVAVGTGTTAPDATQESLVNETFRFEDSGLDRSDVGQVTSEFVIGETEGIGQIEEVAIFGGSLATTTLNSGLMIARVKWSHNKVSGEEIFFQRVDTISN